MDLKCFPLHKSHDNSVLDQCADILNEEWPRSKTARLHSLGKSKDEMPYSLVLMDEGNKVIGHSRLCKVHGQKHACLIESVVIKKCLRGKGLGRTLMTESERIAKRLGHETIFLTTHDKQGFYANLGYTFCQPVVSLGAGSDLLSDEMVTRMFVSSGGDHEEASNGSKEPQDIQAHGSNPKTSTTGLLCSSPTAPPPPPPPPPPLNKFIDPLNSVHRKPDKISWMKKTI